MRQIALAASALTLVLALALAPSGAHASGIGRPNAAGSARAFGFGGAFTAIADDPMALYHNPAGLALQPHDGFLIGVELIVAPRRYTPIRYQLNMAGERELVREPDQSPANTPNVLPALAYMTRLRAKGIPSRIALGIAVLNSFGGQLTYDKGPAGVPALDHVQTAIIEVVPGVAYEVNEFLSVGVTFRLGVGLFGIDATAKPADGEFSAFGVGAGFGLGVMMKPSDRVQVGVVYRSALDTGTTGDGSLALNPGNPDVKTDVSVSHRQEWPQQASAGVSWKANDRLRLAASADWTDWSHVDKIIIEFQGQPDLTRLSTYHVDFQDSMGLHAGGEFGVNDKLAVRAGYTFDSNAVPDRTIERQYLDANKHAVAVGGGYQVTSHWRCDAAFEYVFGPVRTVADNSAEAAAAGWADRANLSPGEHYGTVYTLELNAQYRY